VTHIFRFFAKKKDANVWELDSFEIEHAHKVLKLKPGTVVEVMNGVGEIAIGTIESISRAQVLVNLTQSLEVTPKDIHHAVAIGALKPGDVDEILPALVELGLAEIHVFLQSDTAKYRTSEKSQERWQRVLSAAAKQCKATWLPELKSHDSLKSALVDLQSFTTKLVLDPLGSKSLISAIERNIKPTALVVGGERGLDSSEVALCKDYGFETVSFGKHILRAKTAAQAAAAVLQAMTAPPPRDG
jgi:16S rRNA (uracil1498-N3)-methyltransferase